MSIFSDLGNHGDYILSKPHKKLEKYEPKPVSKHIQDKGLRLKTIDENTKIRDMYIHSFDDMPRKGWNKPFVATENVIITPKSYPHNEAVRLIGQVASEFKARLENKLISDTLTYVIMEALPLHIKTNLDDADKTRAMSEYIFGLVYESTQSLSEVSNYAKMYENDEFPMPIKMLYEAAVNTAYAEAGLRFNPTEIIESVGYIAESLHEVLNLKSKVISIENTLLYESFANTAAYVHMQLEEGGVIDRIRQNVNGTITEVKQNMDTMDKLNKSIEPLSKEQEPHEEKDAKLDNREGEPSANADPTQPTPNTVEDPKKPDPNTNAPVDNNVEKDAENIDNSKAAPPKGAGDANPDTTNANDENTGKNVKSKDPVPTEYVEISEEDSAEIEDAASFAATRGHTFNSGEEKFTEIRRRYTQELQRAGNDGDFQKLKELHAKVTFATDKLKEINTAHGNKYARELNDYAALKGTIQARIGQKLTQTESFIHETMNNVFGMLLNGIKNRELKKVMTTENCSITQAKDKINSKIIANESILYYTVFETLHTAKLLPLNKPPVFESFKNFITSL